MKSTILLALFNRLLQCFSVQISHDKYLLYVTLGPRLKFVAAGNGYGYPKF